MPFLAPIVGAGASIVGGLLGGKKSKSQKNAEQAQADAATEATRQSREKYETSKTFLPSVDKYMGQASANYGDMLDYYRQIFQGGDSAINALLGPQRGQINRGYQARVNNLNLMGPRGGGTNAMLGNLDAERQASLIDLVLGARPDAAKGILGVSGALEGIGQNYGNLALGYAGSSGASLQGASNTLSSLLGNEQINAQRSAEKWGAIGSGVGDIFTALAKKKGWV